MQAPAPGMAVAKGLTLVRHLGSGGMGSIWLAKHAALETEVVVKFMAQALIGDPTCVERFSREAAAASQVKSPHVVQMLDHGKTDDGWPFIVMEHLDGQDLGTYLAVVGRVDPPVALSIVTQTARALSRAHERGVIHRDIKPDNLFLSDTGDGDPFVKVLDFGVAKSASISNGKLTITGSAVGTPHYMSPEQLAASRDLDHRADLWSLAVVTFEMLTGLLPFQCDSPAELSEAVKKGAFAPITMFARRLPRAVDEWFRKACHPDIDQRFATARELAAALGAALANTPVAVVTMPAGSASAFDITLRDTSPPKFFDTQPMDNAPVTEPEEPPPSPPSRPTRAPLVVAAAGLLSAVLVLGAVLIVHHRTTVVPIAAAAVVPSPPPDILETAAPEPAPASVPVLEEVDAGPPQAPKAPPHPPIKPRPKIVTRPNPTPTGYDDIQ